jgi:hypothetical protein
LRNTGRIAISGGHRKNCGCLSTKYQTGRAMTNRTIRQPQGIAEPHNQAAAGQPRGIAPTQTPQPSSNVAGTPTGQPQGIAPTQTPQPSSNVAGTPTGQPQAPAIIQRRGYPHRATASHHPTSRVPPQGNRKGLPLPIHCRPPANSPQWTLGDQSGRDGRGGAAVRLGRGNPSRLPCLPAMTLPNAGTDG